MDLLLQAASACNVDSVVDDVMESATPGTMDNTKFEILRRMVLAKSTTREIAMAVGISERTVRRYRSIVEQGQCPRFVGRGRGRATNEALQECVRQLIVADNCLTLKQIQESVPVLIRKSPSTICRMIKAMKFTRKRVKPIVAARNEMRIIESRLAYSQMIWSIPDEKLIFVDESGFNLHLVPHYGYAPRGMDPHIVVPTQRGANLSLLLAIDIRGLVCWELRVGAYNSVLFTEWCRSTLFPKIRGRDMIVAMDNARFHHSPGVMAAFAEENTRAEFLPPYSPQLNPIENVFGALKSRYRSLRALPKTHSEQVAAVTRLLCDMQIQPLTAFFSEMRLWCERATQRQLFL
jgi:transposase